MSERCLNITQVCTALFTKNNLTTSYKSNCLKMLFHNLQCIHEKMSPEPKFFKQNKHKNQKNVLIEVHKLTKGIQFLIKVLCKRNC